MPVEQPALHIIKIQPNGTTTLISVRDIDRTRETEKETDRLRQKQRE